MKLDFKFKVIKTFTSALERQIFEAVRIKRRSEEEGIEIVNAVGVYNRCHLPRLTLINEDGSILYEPPPKNPIVATNVPKSNRAEKKKIMRVPQSLKACFKVRSVGRCL